ncbi:MAG: formamidopyrimidine-DNA glycosylase, partial [Pusillimonas sp.]|nr:formamidopyrimidine-DNA glycosylase [Pusillimonas sp.]
GDVVVGVGNIYASEALFRARINPKTAAGRLSLARCLRLREAVLSTLLDALHSGGSTLRDYVNATGAPGSYFDIHAAVYNRANQPCRVCLTPIKKIIQGQRATYYCPKCQMR